MEITLSKERKKVVIYLRTSTNTNVGEKKDSDKRQRLACANYVSKNNMDIIKEFYDTNVKGKDPIGNRKGFTELLDYCNKNDVKTILFETASRFSRDQIVQELGYRELKKSGYNLICVDTPDYFSDDANNPSVKMIRQMLGSVSEFQKDDAVLKLNGARLRKKTLNQTQKYLTLDGKGKCEGRKSYLEKDIKLILLVKSLHEENKYSLKEIAYKIYQEGYTNSKGNIFDSKQIYRFIHIDDNRISEILCREVEEKQTDK